MKKKIGTYKGKPIIAIGNNIESKPNIDSKRELHNLYGRPKFIELVLHKLCNIGPYVSPDITNITSKEVTYEYINELQNIAIDLNWFTTGYREVYNSESGIHRDWDTSNKNFNNINMLSSLLNNSPYQDAILVKYNEVQFADDGGSEETPFSYQNPNKKYLDIIVPLGPVYNESSYGPFSLRLIYIEYEMDIQNKTVVCTECKYINYK